MAGLDAARVRANLERVRERIGDAVEICAAVKYVLARRPAGAGGGRHHARGREPRPGAGREAGRARGPVRVGLHRRASEPQGEGRRAARAADPLGGQSDSALAQLERHPAGEVLLQVNVAGEEGKAGIAPSDLGDFIARCPVPVTGLMTMPPLAAAARGQPAALRPPRRAGGRARARAALDGHEPGLRGRRRRGRDDRQARLGPLRLTIAELTTPGCGQFSDWRRSQSRIARESCAPCQASGGSPASSTHELGAREAPRVLLGDRQRVGRVGIVAAAHDESAAPRSRRGARGRRTPAERGTTRTASASASRSRWRSIRWRVNFRTGSRQRGSAGGSNARMKPSTPPRLEPVGQPVPVRERVVVRVGAARVRRGDLHQPRHPLGPLERRRARPWPHPSNARPGRPTRYRASRARPRGRRPGPRTRTPSPGPDSPCPRASYDDQPEALAR